MPTEAEIDNAAWERRVASMKIFRRHSNVCFCYHFGGSSDCTCGFEEMKHREAGGKPRTFAQAKEALRKRADNE